jgi:hypothetical protein
MLSDEGLGQDKRWQSWVRRFSRQKKLHGGLSSSSMLLKGSKRLCTASLQTREISQMQAEGSG